MLENIDSLKYGTADMAFHHVPFQVLTQINLDAICAMPILIHHKEIIPFPTSFCLCNFASDLCNEQLVVRLKTNDKHPINIQYQKLKS